jgi:hypothetical protein
VLQLFNLADFSEVLRQIPHDKYKMAVFAMMTDVVSAGNSIQTKELSTRQTAIEACLKKLIIG